MFAAKVARLGRGLAALTVLSTILLRAKLTRAQDLHPTLLAYKAPPGCPLVGDFQRSVQRRSARIHFVDEGTHDRELSISLRKEGDFTVGELRLIEQNGTLRQRSVRFTSCVEAVEGLALIATVSLDPQALLEDAQPVPETPPNQPAKPPPTPEPPPPPAPVTRAPVPQPVTPREAADLETDLGAEVNLLTRALPKPALGGAVSLGVRSPSRHLFSPLIRVSISHAEQLERIRAAGNANLTLTLVGVSVCPLRIGGDLVVFRPCASLSGGGLHTNRTPSFRPYVSWAGLGELSLRLGELAEIVGDAGVGLPSIHDTFEFGEFGCDALHNCTYKQTTPPLYVSTGLGFRLLLP